MIKPFFFGTREHPLFGVRHAPEGTRAQLATHAVVLCPPLPQEYGSVHWAYRRLAALLAGRGAHVLRFDYRGTGDSSGDPDLATFDAMVEDARAAAEELADATGVKKISLVGMRFGAAVAARLTGTALRDVVLWEPIVRGRDHLDELRRVHQKRERTWLLPPPRPMLGEEDLLGFPMTDAVRRSVEAVELAAGPWADARRFVIVAAASPEASALEAALLGSDKKVTRIVGSGRAGDDANKPGAALVSPEVLRLVADAVVPEWDEQQGARR